MLHLLSPKNIETLLNSKEEVLIISRISKKLGVSHLQFWVEGQFAIGEGMKTFQRTIGGMKLSGAVCSLWHANLYSFLNGELKCLNKSKWTYKNVKKVFNSNPPSPPLILRVICDWSLWHSYRKLLMYFIFSFLHVHMFAK